MENKPTEILIHQASQWYARLHAPDCDEAERLAFREWVGRDPSHRQAYESAVRAARLISDQLNADPRLQALAAKAFGGASASELPHSSSDDFEIEDFEIEDKASQIIGVASYSQTDGRISPQDSGRNSNYQNGDFKGANSPSQKPQGGGLNQYAGRMAKYFRYAAALLVGLGMVAFFAKYQEQNVSEQIVAIHYVNGENAKQRIELSDGSVLFLDVGAAATATMEPQHRKLVLDKGRALFEVAHDTSRPFSVNAAGTEVVALGTRFQVEMASKEQVVNVTLAEGSVAVSNSSGSEKWRQVLSPGQQLRVDNDLNQFQVLTVNPDLVTSWSRGHLAFDGKPLRLVLEEINRYATVKIRLGDSALAETPIGGNFIAGGDSSEFVETLAAVLPIRSVRTGANEIVLFQNYDSQNP